LRVGAFAFDPERCCWLPGLVVVGVWEPVVPLWLGVVLVPDGVEPPPPPLPEPPVPGTVGTVGTVVVGTVGTVTVGTVTVGIVMSVTGVVDVGCVGTVTVPTVGRTSAEAGRVSPVASAATTVAASTI
jgi:hypothetical protein